MCPPPELPLQALQCLSGSRSGAETQARWALVPAALCFPPCPRCANSGEPRVAGSNSRALRALSWLSSKAGPLSGPQCSMPVSQHGDSAGATARAGCRMRSQGWWWWGNAWKNASPYNLHGLQDPCPADFSRKVLS